MSHPTMNFPAPVTYAEMATPGNELPGWLWQGFIAFGALTLFTSRWKTGKTTLVSVLVSRLGSGGPLAGAPTAAAPVLIVSEESHAFWVERGRKTPFGPNVRWLCRPFVGRPSVAEWLALVQHLANLAAGTRTLIVIDPLAMVLPGFDENNAGTAIAALTPLRRLTDAGHAVLLLHHPSKGGAGEPRGSGAITGIADVLIRMEASPNPDQHPNRRWLHAEGRLEHIVAERLIELNAEHTDYHALDPAAEDLTDARSVIVWILNDATEKYTRHEVRENWPEMREKPHPVSLWKWLEQMVGEGRVLRDGEGRPHKPFRYWLRCREKYFFPDLPPLDAPVYTPELSQEELDFAEQVIEQGKEKRRRAKLQKERRGG